MPVRLLPDHLIDRIAAGEVVDRPSSVAKELIENAIDAGARRISVTTADGGKSLLRVEDDGCGMDEADLLLSVRRHATSKLPTDDLDRIATMGFRGEALAAIGSVSRLVVRSRRPGGEGLELEVDFGAIAAPRPVAMNAGTVVEMRSLFSRVPARLKFLKTDRSESAAITDVVRELALANPGIAFVLQGSDRSTLSFPAATGRDAREARIAQVMGADFVDNALPMDAVRHGIRVTGLVGRPTFTRANGLGQHHFVNGRVVRDRQILGAVKAAYADHLFRDRHPVVALFLELPAEDLDVNVHPAKTEVRFRDAQAVRGALVAGIREVLSTGEQTGAQMSDGGVVSAFRTPALASWPTASVLPVAAMSPLRATQPIIDGFSVPSARASEPLPPAVENHPLGAARAQLFRNYIVAQSDDGLILIDQHAAHERLVYERFKARLAEGDVPSQSALIPAVVELTEEECDLLETVFEPLEKVGLLLDRFGPRAIAVNGTPALLGNPAVEPLIKDLVDGLAEMGSLDSLRDRLDVVLGRMACHGSVRSDRELRIDEMNALLREMEATPHSSTCIHGRPTVCAITLSDLERLFGRSK